ncbi:hypothetical protein BYT27DRAFT_7183295 [Phlegmacium glaucopus]|nr:hypothetical protein BYT27DRAFT_7183295 [Phlegmacium glaucopus]
MCRNPNILVPPLQPVAIAVQNEVPKEIADVPLSKNYQPRLDPAKSPRPFPRSDSRNYNVEHLEHLDPSLAPVSSIQLSGNTLADVFTPHAHDPLVPSYVSMRSMSDPTTRSLFLGMSGNSEQPSPPSPNSSLVVPSTSRSHISIPVHYFMLFSSAILFCVIRILHHTVA